LGFVAGIVLKVPKKNFKKGPNGNKRDPRETNWLIKNLIQHLLSGSGSLKKECWCCQMSSYDSASSSANDKDTFVASYVDPSPTEKAHFDRMMTLISEDTVYQELPNTFLEIIDAEAYINNFPTYEDVNTSLSLQQEYGRVVIWDPVVHRFIFISGQRQAQTEGFIKDNDIR
jgi:hypothetical protein